MLDLTNRVVTEWGKVSHLDLQLLSLFPAKLCWLVLNYLVNILELIFKETQSMQNYSVKWEQREKKLKIKTKTDQHNFLSGDIFHPALSLSASHSKIRPDPNADQYRAYKGRWWAVKTEWQRQVDLIWEISSNGDDGFGPICCELESKSL